jgi:hypothetical protein
MSRVDQGGGMDPLQGGGDMSQVYHSGCRDITNMIVMPQGGVSKRTGTQYARDLTADIPGLNASDCQLFRFEFPGADFLTLWSPLSVRVYNTATFNILTPMPAAVFTAATPFTAADVRAMQVAQLQDSMITFTANWRMRALRFRNGAWSLVDTGAAGVGYVAPIYDYRDSLSPPATRQEYDLDIVVSANKVTTPYISGVFGQGGTITVTKASATTTQTSITTAINLCPGLLPGSLQVTFRGTGPQDLKYHISYNFLGSFGDGSGVLTFINGVGWVAPGDELTLTNTTEGTSGGEPLWSGPGVVLHNAVYYRCILAHITATINEPGIGANQATFWTSLGAALPAGTDWTFLFNGLPWAIDLAAGVYNRGWPSTGTAHEQRLVANGPVAARGVIAGSKTGIGQFLNFTVGVNANDAFVFLIVVANGTSIVWLHSQKLLFVGTSVGVFVQTQIPLTPTSVNFSRQANYSLDSFRGFDVAGEVFYVQRNGRQIRRMQYIDTLQSWQATDFTSYAEHLFTEGNRVRDQSYLNSPDGILWVLRTDGGLMSFTYERFYGVAAWAKHATQGTIRALETFFGGSVTKDQIAVVIERPLWNGSAFVTNVFLEVLGESTRNEWFAEMNTVTANWAFKDRAPNTWFAHADAVQQLTGNGTVTLAVAVRFRNKSVEVIENGVHLGLFLASPTGNITLPAPSINGSQIYVGYGFPARIQPTRYEVAAAQTSQSRKMRWVRPQARLFASTMPTINGTPARERSQDDLYDTATGLYTGDVEITNLGYDGELVIEANVPLPFMMTGIFGTMTVDGD